MREHQHEEFEQLIASPEENAKRADSLRSEHLQNGEKPLVACVDAPENRRSSLPHLNRSKTWEETRALREDADYVDYYGDPEVLTNEGFLINDSDIFYVISQINPRNKFSTKFYECTAVAAVGRDKETGENISLLSHEDPYGILPEKDAEISKKFTANLRSRLLELKKRSKEGSVDAIIAGGRYVDWDKNQMNLYRNSIRLLRKEVKNALGFDPVVVVGPKNVGKYPDAILLDTNNRRLYIEHPNVGNATTESYRAGELEKQEKKWQRNAR